MVPAARKPVLSNAKDVLPRIAIDETGRTRASSDQSDTGTDVARLVLTYELAGTENPS
jgi:hypothetical protein